MKQKNILVGTDNTYHIDVFVKQNKGNDYNKIDSICLGDRDNLKDLFEAIRKELNGKEE